MRANVLIVLVNFNGHADTQACIASVLKSDYTNYQIIVVDNSTTQESMNALVSWGHQSALDFAVLHEQEVAQAAPPRHKVVFIKAAENRGFAAGNNIALR